VIAWYARGLPFVVVTLHIYPRATRTTTHTRLTRYAFTHAPAHTLPGPPPVGSDSTYRLLFSIRILRFLHLPVPFKRVLPGCTVHILLHIPFTLRVYLKVRLRFCLLYHAPRLRRVSLADGSHFFI